MKADKVGNYTDVESLKGLTVAVEGGSTGETAAKEAGITDLIATDDMAKALLEVKAGTADACVIDITMAKAMTGEGTDYADLAIAVTLNAEQYGVGFRKDSDLTKMFNEFKAKLMANGTLQELAKKYNLTLVE